VGLLILTVTLNTSLDKLYIIEKINIGDVNRVKNVKYTAGGKGLNVARIIANIGEDVLALGLSGGYLGKLIESELSKQNVPYKFVKIAKESRSCINIIETATQKQTEFLEPGPKVEQDEIERFINLYSNMIDKSEVITLSGSIPKGIDKDIYFKLVKMAKEKEKKVILDTSGQFLIEGIKALPTMVKPNLQELEFIIKKQFDNIEDIKEALKGLAEMGISISVVSMGNNGAILLSKEHKQVYWAKPPKIKAVNTVGCGDAMVAGFAVAMIRNLEVEEMLRLGVAISAASALVEETGKCRIEDIKKLINEVSLNKLSY